MSWETVTFLSANLYTVLFRSESVNSYGTDVCVSYEWYIVLCVQPWGYTFVMWFHVMIIRRACLCHSHYMPSHCSTVCMCYVVWNLNINLDWLVRLWCIFNSTCAYPTQCLLQFPEVLKAWLILNVRVLFQLSFCVQS